MYSLSIQRLIEIFGKFPTVGQRTAARFVFYLIKLDRTRTQELVNAITDLKKNVKICPLCFNVYESQKNLCPVCGESKRDKSILCVVTNETDLLAIETTKKYAGLYFILGGLISGLKEDDLKALRLKQLEARIKNDLGIKEIILAINPTSEGQTTTIYLNQLLRPFGKKITKLGLGLPIGAELEYADEETLASALEGRK
jgi:recombination protein RecR